MAIRAAPLVTRTVPQKDHLVKGSFNISVAHMELKTSPAAYNVDKTGKGNVEICMVLPNMLTMTNMPIPNCHLRLR